MNVAVLAHSFPRFPGDTHGPFVRRLCESLAARGHRVWALLPFDPELAPFPGDPLTVVPFRYVWPDRWHLLGYSRTLRRDIGLKIGAAALSPLYFACAERALVRLVRRERIEFIHAHWILPNGFVAARAAAATGVPFAATLHGSDVFMAERNPLFRALAARALADAAYVTSCSPDLAQRLLALGGRQHAAKVHLVANGTDPAPAAGGRASRERLGVPAAAPLVVAVGRMVDKKGFDVLLDALPALRARIPGVRLALGGGGPLLEPLREQARRLGVDEAVVFPGSLAHGEVLELVAAGDVFAMPSVRDPKGNIDGLPIVVLEAMAAGRPVVATSVAGMPLAVADGQTGRLVPERDPAALAGALAEVLADPAKAKAWGDAGRRRVETELNWAAVAKIHDGLLRAAVGTAAGSSDGA